MSDIHQQCGLFRYLLEKILGIDAFLDEALNTETSFTISPADNPFLQLWNCLRFVVAFCPLMNIYRLNSIVEIRPIRSAVSNPKATKWDVSHFVAAWHKHGIETFQISELYFNDTNLLVKVLKTVEELLERIEKERIIFDSCETSVLSSDKEPKLSLVSSSSPYRQSTSDTRILIENTVAELVETEWKYVNDLKHLRRYISSLLDSKLLGKFESYSIFGYLNSLLDFETKFLIRFECQSNEPSSSGHIGILCSQNEEAFSVYGHYCYNHENALSVNLSKKEYLQRFAASIEPSRELQSYRIKPIQRICQFPLIPETNKVLLKEIMGAHVSYERLTPLSMDCRKIENQQIFQYLLEYVEDWKGLKPKNFGQLLLHGSIIVLIRKEEREAHMFLFETILICCKKEKRTRSFMRRSSSSSNSNSSRFTKYLLKGRVAVNGIEGVVSSSKYGKFDLEMLFKGYKTGKMESITLRFVHEELQKKWYDELETLLDRKKSSAPPSSERRRINTNAQSRHNSVSHLAPESAKDPCKYERQIQMFENGRLDSQDGASESFSKLRIRMPLISARISPLATPTHERNSDNVKCELGTNVVVDESANEFSGQGFRSSSSTFSESSFPPQESSEP